MNSTSDTFLKPEDLARRWGMAVGTLSNWRREGKGPKFIKLGNGPRPRVVYKLADVEAFERQESAA